MMYSITEGPWVCTNCRRVSERRKERDADEPRDTRDRSLPVRQPGIPVEAGQVGDLVVVRPGEKIRVDREGLKRQGRKRHRVDQTVGDSRGGSCVNVYEKYVLPKLIHWAMRRKIATTERKKFIPLASGTVLEVGVGSGLNLPFYGPQVQKLYALDPSRELWKMARKRVREASFPVEFLAASAERIPLEDMSVDTVVTTWALCTIPDPSQALTDMRRVLKPEGRLIFVEHGRSPDPGVSAWQNRLTRAWKRIGGGCHLNRKIDDLIADAGFDTMQIERGYSRGPKPMTYLYKGFARRAA